MAAIAVIPRPGKIKAENLEAIVMDAVINETHTLTNTITEHPVEKGGDISDHIRPEPDEITMQCVISNTPLSTSQQSRAVRLGEYTLTTTNVERGQIGDMQGLAASAWKNLKKLRTEGVVVTVSTTLEDYTSMAIKSITVPRSAKNYDALEFTISFKKIVIVQNKLTRSKTTNPSSQTKGKAGAQTTKANPDANAKPTSAVKETFKSSINNGIKKIGVFFQ
jgi:hypothetical protein